MCARLKLRLSKKPRGEGYWAHLGSRDEMSYERVLEEAANRSSMSPAMLRSAFETVMDSMIEHTLEDGISRTAGEYFKLRLDVRGSFESAYDFFDEDKHELALNLQVLKGLKRCAKGSLVERPYTPVVLESIANQGGEEGVIDINKNVVITGKRLIVHVDEVDEAFDDETMTSPRGRIVTDSINYSIFCHDGYIFGGTYGSSDVLENDSTHILLTPPNMSKMDEMRTHRPYKIVFEVNSCGGDDSARRQSHKITAKLLV